MQRDMIMLDDGDFYIELNGNYDAASAPGLPPTSLRPRPHNAGRL
jgi:hypothetical protein